jgi:fatty acid desaturase
MNQDEIYRHSPETRRRITDIFSREEVRHLTARSDLRGAWLILSTWLVIAAAFALIAWAVGQPLLLAVPLVTVGVAVLGGRQLALAIITHEATHRTLFKTRWANDGLTDWLCARPIGLDLAKYRAHHFIHHARTGTDEDSHISLIQGLPTTRMSLVRKFARDLAGLTGVKYLIGLALMNAGVIRWTVASDVERLPRNGRHAGHYLLAFLRNSLPTLITNGILFGVFWMLGMPWLYLAWLGAYLSPYPFFLRVRALAEHAATERTTDMFRNTRTTRAGWLARSFVAPCHVNFHIEHHAMAAVPWFRLPEAHRLLRARQVVPEPPGYWQVMQRVSSRQAPQSSLS